MAEPLPICHLNGEWPALREARISPLDRSFLFGDGVYEVVPVFEGRPFRFAEHFDRLSRSLAALHIRDPHSRDAWRALVHELMQRNGGGADLIFAFGAAFDRHEKFFELQGPHQPALRALRRDVAAQRAPGPAEVGAVLPHRPCGGRAEREQEQPG